MEHVGDYLTIQIGQDRNLIISHWLRFVSSDEFREGMERIQLCIKDHNLVYWLADMLHFTAPNLLDQSWTIDYFIELIEKTHLKKIALVMPGDYILHMIAEKMKKKIYQRFGHNIVFECFSRQDHAQYWIDNAEESAATQ